MKIEVPSNPFYQIHAEYLHDHQYDPMPPIGLTFDDVLLQPRHSEITSRKDPREIILRANVAGDVFINSPIMSANMDTVTEWQMAQEMASLGGVGVIHRYLTADEQARQVRIVKERTRAMEDIPLTIHPDATAGDIRQLWKQHKRGYVLVSNIEGNILGIVTKKDVDSALNETDKAISFMTPRDRLITVPQGTTLEQAEIVMKSKKVEKVPVVDDAGKIVGMYTRKDAELFEKYPNASRDPKGRLIVGAAIGVKDIEAEVERAHKLAEAGADFIIIDIAHGDSENMLRMLDRLVKEGFDIPIIAGNIATEDAAKILIDHGAKGLKVGIGPGWACDTRVIAGVGRAQLSAVASVAAVANPQGIAIIADGGMREPADLVKALVCGADAGMFGGMFAGTDETPGKVIRRGDQRVKRYEGMASDAARARATSIAETLSSAGPYEERYLDQTQAAPEGREREVPVKGPVGIIFRRLDAGVRSGASYIGAHNIYEMREKGWFERVTGAGANEQYGRIG